MKSRLPHKFHEEEARSFLDCKTVGFFFSKSVKKSVKRGVRVLRARPTVRFPYNEFVPTRGSKMSSSCQKSVHNSALFVNLIHSGIDFEGELARVNVCTWLRILTLQSSNSKAVFSVASL